MCMYIDHVYFYVHMYWTMYMYVHTCKYTYMYIYIIYGVDGLKYFQKIDTSGDGTLDAFELKVIFMCVYICVYIYLSYMYIYYVYTHM